MPMTPRRSSNLRHTFLFVAACLLLTWPPTAARAASPLQGAGSPPRQTSAPEDEGRPLRKPGGFTTFGKNFLAFLKCKTANDIKRRELLEYGPQFPERYNPGDFSFHALVGANWPMVVEYELERQSTAVITIQVMDAAPFTQTLKGEGIGEEQTARFTLPAYKRMGPLPARISLKATRDGSGEQRLARFRFLGAGAGEDAVVARLKEPSGLEVAALGPLPPGIFRHAPAPPQRRCPKRLCNARLSPASDGSFNYSFDVLAPGRFDKWTAEIRTIVNGTNSELDRRVTEAGSAIQRIGPGQTFNHPWNGRYGKGRRVERGQYRVFVMAWLSAGSSGQWNADNRSPLIPIN